MAAGRPNRAVFGLNLEPHGWPKSLAQVEVVGYYKDVKGTHTAGADVWSDVPLDVVYVCDDEDLPVLPTSAESVVRNLRHPIGDILFVAPSHSEIRAHAKRMGGRYVCENDILPIGKKDIKYIVPGFLNSRKEMTYDRSGWLLQQLLKFSGDSVSEKSHYLVMDADTVLTKPQMFIKDDQDLLLHAWYYHHPYIEAYLRLLQLQPATLITSVVHHMLFNKVRLQDLKHHMEAVARMPWYEAIKTAADLSNTSGFSEYETYGQWCARIYPTRTLREYCFNTSVPRSQLDKPAVLEAQFGSEWRSVSFHWYLD